MQFTWSPCLARTAPALAWCSVTLPFNKAGSWMRGDGEGKSKGLTISTSSVSGAGPESMKATFKNQITTFQLQDVCIVFCGYVTIKKRSNWPRSSWVWGSPSGPPRTRCRWACRGWRRRCCRPPAPPLGTGRPRTGPRPGLPSSPSGPGAEQTETTGQSQDKRLAVRRRTTFYFGGQDWMCCQIFVNKSIVWIYPGAEIDELWINVFLGIMSGHFDSFTESKAGTWCVCFLLI